MRGKARLDSTTFTFNLLCQLCLDVTIDQHMGLHPQQRKGWIQGSCFEVDWIGKGCSGPILCPGHFHLDEDSKTSFVQGCLETSDQAAQETDLRLQLLKVVEG